MYVQRVMLQVEEMIKKKLTFKPVAVAEWLALLCVKSPNQIRHPASAETGMWGSNWLPCWPPKDRRCHSRDEFHRLYNVGCPLWLWNPEETSPEVENRGISGPTKRTYVLKYFLKKQLIFTLQVICGKFKPSSSRWMGFIFSFFITEYIEIKT